MSFVASSPTGAPSKLDFSKNALKKSDFCGPISPCRRRVRTSNLDLQIVRTISNSKTKKTSLLFTRVNFFSTQKNSPKKVRLEKIQF